jgi:hypothetical protein
MIPEIENDNAVQTLIETFNARLVMAHNKTHFYGELNTRVQYGSDNFITLPPVFFSIACAKDELEREAIPSMFAYWLIQNPDRVQTVGRGAARYNSDEFMGKVREYYAQFRTMDIAKHIVNQ